MFTPRACAALAAAAALLGSGTGPASAQKPTGKPAVNEVLVQICHIPPGQPRQRKTMTVPLRAVAAHLAHGDRMGSCDPEIQACARLDGDDDGVNNCDDRCPQTPASEHVDASGCSLLVLRVDAGRDLHVTAGEAVAAKASLDVVQGTLDPNALFWTWSQTAGPPAAFTATGTEFNLDTTGLEGLFTFRATAATDGGVSASDEFSLEVLRARVVRVAAGRWHNVAMYNDAHVVIWGWERYGQLGDGHHASGLADVDAAARQSLLVTQEGELVTFGVSVFGSSASSFMVPGLVDVLQAAGTVEGAVVLEASGQVWGYANPTGGCTLGGASPVTATGSPAVVPVLGAPANVVAVDAGATHAVALDANGTAWVWGTRFGCAPRAVLTDVASVAAGDTDYFLFARNDGSAWGLGFNLHGQLGTGNTISNYTTPRQVVGLSDVVVVAAGDRHSLFVKRDGSLWMSGWNRYCQLGLEDAVFPAVPQFGTNVLVPTESALADVVAVAGGENHSVAVTGDGTVWAWGQNNVGQLHANTFSTLAPQVCMPMVVEIE